MVSQKDIAIQAGVSQFVVSSALSSRRQARIAPETRQRVRDIAQQMGYVPNRSARALVTGRTHLVALQIHRLNSPYAWMVAQEMQHIAIPDGYELLTREYGRGDLTVQSSVDGILALDTAHFPNPDHRLRVPYVLMGRLVASSLPMAQSLGLDLIGIDLEYGARLAVEHLLAQGKRRIAHVTTDEPQQQEDGRSRGYRAVMEAAGLAAELITAPIDSREGGYDAMRAYAGPHGFPDGLFCRNDEMAMGCLLALHERGRSVPGETAVIGYDGLSEGRFVQPSLSTVSQPVGEMCRIAWQLLRTRMQEPDAPPQITILRPSLLLRQSA